MNAAAERQVKAGNALRIVNNRLVPTDPRACATIAKAIDEVATNESGARPYGGSLGVPDTNGAGYVATLLPMEQGRRHSILAPFAAFVALFPQDREQLPLMTGEAFPLPGSIGSRGELRVLLALAQGLAPRKLPTCSVLV